MKLSIFDAYTDLKNWLPDRHMVISQVPGAWEKIEIEFDKITPNELRGLAVIAEKYDFEVCDYEYGLKLIRVIENETDKI